MRKFMEVCFFQLILYISVTQKIKWLGQNQDYTITQKAHSQVSTYSHRPHFQKFLPPSKAHFQLEIKFSKFWSLLNISYSTITIKCINIGLFKRLLKTILNKIHIIYMKVYCCDFKKYVFFLHWILSFTVRFPKKFSYKLIHWQVLTDLFTCVAVNEEIQHFHHF